MHSTKTTPSTMPLSELRRRLTVGTELTLVEAGYVSEGDKLHRTVMGAYPTGVLFDAPEADDGNTWLPWAKQITVEPTEIGFRIIVGGGTVVGYAWGHL